jgi:hypothetical protein
MWITLFATTLAAAVCLSVGAVILQRSNYLARFTG